MYSEAFKPVFSSSLPTANSVLGASLSMLFACITHTTLWGWTQKLFVSSTSLFRLTDFILSLPTVASFAIFYRYFHACSPLDLVNCIPSLFMQLAPQDFCLKPNPILSNSMSQRLTSTRTHSFFYLVKSGTPNIFLFLNSCGLPLLKKGR